MTRVQSVICWISVQVLGWVEERTYNAQYSLCLALTSQQRTVEVWRVDFAVKLLSLRFSEGVPVGFISSLVKLLFLSVTLPF